MVEIPIEFQLEKEELSALTLLYNLFDVSGWLFAVEDKEGNWSEMLKTLKKLEAWGLAEVLETSDIEFIAHDTNESSYVKAHKFRLSEDMGFVMMQTIAQSGIEFGEVALINGRTNQLIIFKFDYKPIESDDGEDI